MLWWMQKFPCRDPRSAAGKRCMLLDQAVSVHSCGRHSPVLAGRWLGSMAPTDAAQEMLESMDAQQRRDALVHMKPHVAAGLLEVL